MVCGESIMEGMKDELKVLMKERESIEKEIEERSSRLLAPGGPGLAGNLVDKEVRHRMSSLHLHAPLQELYDE